MKKLALTICFCVFLAQNAWANNPMGIYKAHEFSDYNQSGYYTIQKASDMADKGDLEKANHLYKKASTRLPQSLMTYFSLGETAYKLSETAKTDEERVAHLQDAKWAYYRVVNLHPDITLGFYKLAEITWELEDYKDSLAILTEGLEMHPYDLLMTYSLGLTEEKLGHTEAAKSAYEDVIAINPKYAPVYSSLGGVYEELNDTAKAEANYRKALLIDPENVEFQVTLAAFLANDGRVDEAEDLAQSALKQEPDNYLVYVTLGHIQYDRQQYEKALIYYTKATKLNPDYAASYFYMSLTLEQLNRGDEALAEGMHYVNVSPDGRYAKQANELILTLKQKKN